MATHLTLNEKSPGSNPGGTTNIMSGGEMAATSAFEADTERCVGSSPTRIAKLRNSIMVSIFDSELKGIGSTPIFSTN